MDNLQTVVQLLLHEAEAILGKKQTLLIAIDGRCAAGKTTLSARLQEAYPCNVLHMDHFFLRPEQRTTGRLKEPGGNVDYERFGEEALSPLKRGEAFSYRPFDCHRQTFAEAVRICPRPVSLIEGSYSCHPSLWDAYDLRVFLTVDPKEQLSRIRKRNGEASAVQFQEKWIPLEEAYFSAYRVQERCDFSFQLQ